MTRRASGPKPPPTFEKALEQLEQIIQQIESGQVGLEQAIQQYEQGTRLIRHCREILDRAEKKIQELTVQDSRDKDDTDKQQ